MLNFFEFIRSLLGWSNDEIKFPTESAIVVYNHTSFLDILSTFIYFDKCYMQDNFQPILIVKNAWYTHILGMFINVVYAPSIHNKGSNGVNYIYDQIMAKKKINKNILIPISPKGTIINSKWRTGYYYIAKKLGYKICVLTPDFSKRKIVSSQLYSPEEYSYNELEQHLKSTLSYAGVLNIENSEELKDCCPYESSLPFDLCTVSMFFFLPYVILTFIKTSNVLLQFLSMVWFYYSLDYHMNYEYSHIVDKKDFEYIKKRESYLAKIVILLQIYETYSSKQNDWSKLQIYPMIVSFLSGLFFYLNSIPREHMTYRNKYALFHGFFHIAGSIFMLQLIS